MVHRAWPSAIKGPNDSAYMASRNRIPIIPCERNVFNEPAQVPFNCQGTLARMTGGSPVGEDLRVAIVKAHQDGKSGRAIALAMHVPRSTVRGIIRRYVEDGTVDQKRRTGRPKATTPQDDRILGRLLRRNRREACADINKEWSVATERCCPHPRANDGYIHWGWAFT